MTRKRGRSSSVTQGLHSIEKSRERSRRWKSSCAINVLSRLARSSIVSELYPNRPRVRSRLLANLGNPSNAKLHGLGFKETYDLVVLELMTEPFRSLLSKQWIGLQALKEIVVGPIGRNEFGNSRSKASKRTPSATLVRSAEENEAIGWFADWVEEWVVPSIQ